jgi:ATP-dependent RNA helicase DbpA
MVTLQIDGGKKQKVRAGDIVGALTADGSITREQLGKIQLADNWSFVAVTHDACKMALTKLTDGKLKGRSFRVRLLNS